MAQVAVHDAAVMDRLHERIDRRKEACVDPTPVASPRRPAVHVLDHERVPIEAPQEAGHAAQPVEAAVGAHLAGDEKRPKDVP